MESERRNSPPPYHLSDDRSNYSRMNLSSWYKPQLPPPASDNPNADHLFLLKPAGWVADLISSQLIFVSRLISDSLSFHDREELDDPLSAKNQTPAAWGGRRTVQKLGLGLASAAHVCFILVALLVVSLVVGVGLVRLYIEQPVVAKEGLVFDYTEEQPSATMTVVSADRPRAAPVGHTFFVSVEMVLPESDYNRDIGVFQISAEAIAGNGAILAKSGQPCMLRFRSLPVRLIHTFLTCIPLLLGFSDETQTLKIPVLCYKEIAMKTEQIKIRLHPRAGTMGLPQIYSAGILLNSRPPWRKEVVRNWRLTFYIWSTLYVYIMLLMVLVTCCRGAVFPAMSRQLRTAGEDPEVQNRERLRVESQVGAESSEGESYAFPRRHRALRRMMRQKRKDRVHADDASPSCSIVTGDEGDDISEVTSPHL